MPPEDQTAHALGPAIRAIRTKVGLTQEELSDASGIAQSIISKYERGAIKPGLDALLSIDAACKQPSGTVLRLAGLIEDPTSADDLIASDPRVAPENAHALLTLYRAVAEDRSGSEFGKQVKRRPGRRDAASKPRQTG